MAFSEPIPDNFGDRRLSVAISSISTAAVQSWLLSLTDEGKEWDKYRTAYLNSLGIRVIRFTNKQVNQEFDAVCRAIDAAIEGAW